jgi:putative solute:sodium symporter small subunit
MADLKPDGDVPDRPSVTDPETVERHAEYWRRNVRYLWILIAIWFTVSYGFGIIFADTLNAYRIPGTSYPVGFWFAQQGSIYVFVVLIFVYVRLMNRLDREFQVDEGGQG